MLEANDMVEAKLAEIRERKIYEMKRMFAAKMHEGVGGLTKAEVEERKKAGYKRASEVLGDPRKEKLSAATKRYREERASEKKKEETKTDKRPPSPPKVSKAPRIDMSKERRIGEETLDEAGLGFGAQAAHGMSPAEKTVFKSMMKVRRKSKEEPKASAPKSPKSSKPVLDYPDTPGGRNRRRADERLAKREGPESGKSAWERSVGGKIANVAKKASGPVGALSRELGSIGFTNLE